MQRFSYGLHVLEATTVESGNVLLEEKHLLRRRVKMGSVEVEPRSAHACNASLSQNTIVLTRFLDRSAELRMFTNSMTLVRNATGAVGPNSRMRPLVLYVPFLLCARDISVWG